MMVAMHRGGNSPKMAQVSSGWAERGMPQHGLAMSVAGWPPGKRLKLAEARWQMAELEADAMGCKPSEVYIYIYT